MNADLTQSETNPRKPTTFQLLGDAIAYMRQNFTIFLLYGGGLIAVFKLIYIIEPWVRDDPEDFRLWTLAWPVYFFAVFLKAIFAYNVHNYVLLDQRKFSFALNKTFWLFLAAVLAIQLAFLIPAEIFESFLSVERLTERRLAETPFPEPFWFLLPPLADITASFFVFILIARFLTIPPGIVAHGKISLSANLKIGRALYWQIFWGLLILHMFLNLYAFLVGLSLWPLLESFMSMEDEYYSLVSLSLRTVLLTPVSFFYVLLGATYTAAAYKRGSEYLGLVKVEEE